MRKPVLLALSLAFLVSAQSALAAGDAGDAGNFGTPIKSGVSVSFPDSSATFQPTPEALELLADARNAAIIYISGRTSTLRPSAADEALALRRALSARSYLVARGVSPLKIMVNFASAADFVADNSTAEGRRENQRVDIEVVYIPTY
ncbi:OmpA family protein [Pseudomonas putida]|uniref:OmpA family protein n=1 Tax=Pseudomonas putida TaxID=303 RepID=UPI0035A42FDD